MSPRKIWSENVKTGGPEIGSLDITIGSNRVTFFTFSGIQSFLKTPLVVHCIDLYTLPHMKLDFWSGCRGEAQDKVRNRSSSTRLWVSSSRSLAWDYQTFKKMDGNRFWTCNGHSRLTAGKYHSYFLQMTWGLIKFLSKFTP